MELLDSLKYVYFWNNSLYDYSMAALLFLGLLLALKIFQVIILARLQHLAAKTQTDFDDVVIEIFKKIKPPFYFFIALYFAISILNVASIISKALFVLFLIAIVFEIVQAVSRALDYWMRRYLRKNREKGEAKQQSESMIKLLQSMIKAALWIFGFILILSNLGVNVTSLVAGLGIGGLAIALALQNVLGDLFSAFSLYLDKPFKVGDFIVIGNDMGIVEKIGIKTTRITTLQGEQLVVSNQELTTSRIQNFQRMDRRRVVVSIGVAYETEQNQLKAIPEYIKNIIVKTKMAEFDRCHFSEYGDSSLNFEIVFYVESSDYNTYMDIRQKINYEIFEKFAKEKIEFAYPTQTIHLQK